MALSFNRGGEVIGLLSVSGGRASSAASHRIVKLMIGGAFRRYDLEVPACEEPRGRRELERALPPRGEISHSHGDVAEVTGEVLSLSERDALVRARRCVIDGRSRIGRGGTSSGRKRSDHDERGDVVHGDPQWRAANRGLGRGGVCWRCAVGGRGKSRSSSGLSTRMLRVRLYEVLMHA